MYKVVWRYLHENEEYSRACDDLDAAIYFYKRKITGAGDPLEYCRLEYNV